MNNNIKDYIGYIQVTFSDEKNPQIGTCIFINSRNNRMILTAKHVVAEGTIGNISINYKGTLININSDEYKIKFENDCAILFIISDKIIGPEHPLCGFNTSFKINHYQVLNWETVGYVGKGLKPKITHLDGRLCDISEEHYDYLISDIVIKHTSYEGMSGSPVIINDAIVGILQAQDIIENWSNNLYFSSLKNIEQYLPQESILTNLYNNIFFEKIKYDEKFELNNYISRSIKVYGETDDTIFSFYSTRKLKCTLFELIKGKPDFYVLLGEAALGKTFELQQLAISLQKNKEAPYPLYKNLKNIVAGQSIENFIPEINDYLDNQVPFCLILDGYDEITDESFRDIEFPKMLSQFAEKIKTNSKTDKFSIVVSSRKNYYTHNKFDNFTSLEICPLNYSDIKNEVSKCGIDYIEFTNQISGNDLSSFVQNPFYLSFIITIYLKNNGILPPKHKLMSEIIDSLFKHINYPKFKGLKRLTETNQKSRNLLQKIATAYLLSGRFIFTEDDFIELIDQKVDSISESLINCTNILDRDSDNNYCFKHNNFREYLAAEFLNNKFNDDLQGILNIISFPDKKGIKKNYLNMVSFLILIRENNDLTNWISKNCPENFSLFESDKFDDKKRLLVLKSAIENANSKAYFATHDYNSNLSKLVCNDECIQYLLDIISVSEEDIPLYNALRILQGIKNTFASKKQIKEILLDFLNSDRGNENHCRDAIMVFTDLKINSNDITEFFHFKYSATENKEIRRGLYHYICENNLSDKFAEFLVKGLSLKSRSEITSYALTDSIKKFKDKNSFIALFEYLSELKHSNYIINTFIKYICTNEFLDQLSSAYSFDSDTNFLNLIINTSCVFVEKFYEDINVFSIFFTKTCTEHLAIEAYFRKYSNNPVIFANLSNKLSIYCNFLKEGYEKQKFADNKNSLFNYCVRLLGESSIERHNLLNIIRESNYSDALTSIKYITYNDNYSEKQYRKTKLTAEYIFDYDKLKKDTVKLIDEFNEINMTLKELWNVVYKNFSYLDLRHAILDTLNIHMKFNNTVSGLFQCIESSSINSDFWILKGASDFIVKHDDYNKYITEEQLLLIEELCNKYIYQYHPEENIEYSTNGCTIKCYNIRYVLQLIEQLDFSLNDDTLCKLLYVPADLFGCSTNGGFSEYLVNHISEDKIIKQICYYIDNNLAHNMFGDECIRYCTTRGINVDKVIQLSIDILSNKQTNNFTFYCWEYLIKIKKENLIVKLVKERKINEKDFIEHISLLMDYSDNKYLLIYASEIFDSLYSYYLALDDDYDVSDELIKEHPYITTIVSSNDINTDTLKSNLTYCLKKLITFLVKNGSEKQTKIYLDSMIEANTYSFLEQDVFETLIANISSVKFLNQLIILLNMICNQYFKIKEFSSILSDIQKSLIIIGHKHFDEVVNKLSEYKSDKNESMRRMANIIIDTLKQEKNETLGQQYSIDEIKKFIFN